MNLGAVRTLILERRGMVLALVVVLLGAVAALLAANVLAQARQLAAGAPPATAAPTAVATPVPTAQATTPEPIPTPDPTPQATPEPTPEPTPIPTPEGITGWASTGTFGSSDVPTGVLDLTAWNGSIVAVGTAWEHDNAEPRMWRSVDGRSWSETALDLGPDASLQVVTALPDGRLLILGTVGDDVAYWNDESRAAAWTSVDGATWVSSEVPFGARSHYGPIEFAAGARGLVATNGEEIWHSVDGVSWHLAYEAPRGTWVYGPVAGDEGWIVKRASASLGTTTLVVSGDAVTWYDVDLGNVATVANVAGDWLVARQSDDWTRTEVLRSANGLDWNVIVDLSQLAPPEGTEVTANGAVLAGTDEVLLMSPWEGGHCGGMPSSGWGAWWSVDGIGWTSAGIGANAVVTHVLDIGDDTVLAGYTDGSGEIGFWISTP